MKSRIFAIILLFSSLVSYSQKKDYRWKFIKNEDRLSLLKNNVTKTGIVTKVITEADGDLHIWIRLKDSSTIACEIICYNPNGKSYCNGYANKITKPKKSDKVKVMGDYVFDNKHKWFEIHPVKSIIKQ